MTYIDYNAIIDGALIDDSVRFFAIAWRIRYLQGVYGAQEAFDRTVQGLNTNSAVAEVWLSQRDGIIQAIIFKW